MAGVDYKPHAKREFDGGGYDAQFFFFCLSARGIRVPAGMDLDYFNAGPGGRFYLSFIRIDKKAYVNPFLLKARRGIRNFTRARNNVKPALGRYLPPLFRNKRRLMWPDAAGNLYNFAAYGHLEI